MSGPRLTIRGALKLARVKFGKTAVVEKRVCVKRVKPDPDGKQRCSAELYGAGHGDECTTGRPYYIVGRVDMGMFFTILGASDTWEKALVKAGVITAEAVR